MLIKPDLKDEAIIACLWDAYGLDFGSLLLARVEENAKECGAHLVHLDTFDVQAKDFHLKNGYEVFGVLDDCPKGHKSYYVKKVL